MAVTYHPDGCISLPIQFSQSITSLTRTDFDVIKTPDTDGDDIHKMEYWLIGSGMTYELWFLPEIDTASSFDVSFTGNALSELFLPLTIRPPDLDPSDADIDSLVTIPYNAKIPVIVDSYIPEKITRISYSPSDTPPSYGWQIYIEFNFKIRGLKIDSFLYEGLDLSATVLQRLISDDTEVTKPNDPDDSDESSVWTTPNGNNDWIDVNMTGNTVPSKYFRLIFDTDYDGIDGNLNLILKDKSVTNSEIIA